MMRYLKCIVLLLYFHYCAFSQVTFQKPIVFKLYGCWPTGVLELPNGYLIASWGRSEYNGTDAFRSGIIFHKTDLYGNLIWEKIYNQPGKAYSIGLYGSLAAIEDGYLLCGTELDTITNEQDFYFAKFDTFANLLWMKKYPRGGTQNCLHGSLTSDKGYIIIGESFTSTTWANYYVLKADSNGNKQWDKFYGGGDNDSGRKIHQTSDGGYIMSGISRTYGHGEHDLWLIKTDSSGSEEWDKTYGTALDDRLRCITLANDGGYIGWGSLDTSVYTPVEYTALVLKLDEDGNVVWRTFFNHKRERIIYQLRELDDGSIVAIGQHDIGGIDGVRSWIAKLNSSGEVLWERFYEGPGTTDDTLFSFRTSFDGDFQQTSDGGFIITGQAWRSTSAASHVFWPHPWLVKLDSNGCLDPDSCGLDLGVGVSEIQPTKSSATIITYPNPFTTEALISIKANSAEFAYEKIEFQLFDVSGRLMQANNYSLNQYGYCEFYIERGHYSSGIYFYQVTTQKAVLGKGKLIAR